MKSKKAGVVLFVILAISALLIAYAFTFGKKKDGMPGKGQMPGKTFRGGGGVSTEFSVVTQIAEQKTLHGYIVANGEIESQNSVSVYPDASGKIISTKVLLGSSVKRGDIIAYVDPSQPGEHYRQSPVYAPISGSIISTPIKNGSTVSANTEITKIGDISNLQILADIPERYVSFLRNGLKGKISVQAYPEESFSVTVKRVSPVVDATSRTKQIILTFDNRDSRINAGMFAKLILFTKDYSGAVTMPKNSLVTNEDKYYAYVVLSDSTVERREVSLGEEVDGIVQIISGIKEGEKVVTQGQTSLSQGAKVKDITGAAEELNAKYGSKDKEARGEK
ncbi:MAG: efflux RND transporter periplasmic adaptor subunit [Treponema sp.]|nr:efflux RND transporter periplasmic adaptor subunit [Treponema sp.]